MDNELVFSLDRDWKKNYFSQVRLKAKKKIMKSDWLSDLFSYSTPQKMVCT